METYTEDSRSSFTPTEIKITDKSDNDTRTLGNVLAGEVWLASGQSNMEMPMRGFWHQPVEGAGEQVMFSRSLGKRYTVYQCAESRKL